MSVQGGVLHELLYTVPYESETQPIEKLWRVVKDCVARCYTRKRTREQLTEHVRAGFYGGLKSFGAVGATRCALWIKHAKDEVNKWIRADGVLKGQWPDAAPESEITVDNLTAERRAGARGKVHLVVQVDGDEEEDVPEVEELDVELVD